MSCWPSAIRPSTGRQTLRNKPEKQEVQGSRAASSDQANGGCQAGWRHSGISPFTDLKTVAARRSSSCQPLVKTEGFRLVLKRAVNQQTMSHSLNKLEPSVPEKESR